MDRLKTCSTLFAVPERIKKNHYGNLQHRFHFSDEAYYTANGPVTAIRTWTGNGISGYVVFMKSTQIYELPRKVFVKRATMSWEFSILLP